MSYPHYPRPPVNVSPYPSNMSPLTPPTSLGQTSGSTPPLTIIPSGTTVLAYYQDYAWYFGVVQSYNLTRSGSLIYQVLFRSGEIRAVASSQVLSQQSNNQNIEIGSRVVVQHPTKSMFISSLVAELPSVENAFRYLLFLDDGSACYKTKDKLWVINLVENPILMLPPPYKSFIQRFFTMTGSTVKLIGLNPNDSVNFTNFDNTSLQFSGKVIEVDCSIALIRYSIPSGGLAEEWIHRGSSRILSYGHNQYYSAAGDLHKNNGSAKQMPGHLNNEFNSHQASQDQQMFIKSPLKGKPFMVPPSLDPFMFSEDESAMPSVSKSAKYNAFNSWPVSNNASSRSTTYGNQMFSPKHAPPAAPQAQPQSPILILDESPSKEPPPYSSPKPVSSFPSSVGSNQSPLKSQSDSFISPSSMTLSPHAQKPASVFSWSASEESGTRRRLDLSPKLSIDHDVDFDFADTILNTPVSSAVTPPTFSLPPISKSVPEDTFAPPSIKKEEVVVIDDNDNLPPLVVENETKNNVMLLDATQLQVKESFKNEGTTRNVPMILHQEACLDSFTAPTAMETSTQNGNVIEVVVCSSNNGESFISVTPSVEVITAPVEKEDPDSPTEQEKTAKEKPVEPLILEVKEEEEEITTSPPNGTKSRKRRMVSPLKSPKIAIPKVKINLKAIAESSKDLAAQKCVKRARKQQSKDTHKQGMAERKKKMAKMTELNMKSLLMIKKDPIKLNPEAKISRWCAPWISKTIGNRYHSVERPATKKASGDILQKVVMLKTEEELEEGEIDDSDGEEASDKRTHTPLPCTTQSNHTCSFLCNKFPNVVKSSGSPLSLPSHFGWERMLRNGKITYITPCGIVCTGESDVLTHLTMTKCTNLYVSNFCFLPDIELGISTSKPDFDPLYSDNDLSGGLESVPVSFLSNIGPIIKYSFHYIIDLIHDYNSKQLDSELVSCTCEGTCSSSCICRTMAPARSECNTNCSCSIGCPNRVVQRGLQQQLQIIQDDTSFKVKALHDIPRDTFICIVTGVVKKLIPENENFLFPLSRTSYFTDSEKQAKSTESTEQRVNKKPNSTSSFYHDEHNLIMSTDLESVNRFSDHNLLKTTRHNPFWVKTASRYGKLEALSDPDIASTYPSLLTGRKELPPRSKRSSSTSKEFNNVESKKAEIYLDCTEYGNVGRFLPIGDDFNTEIQPVIIDSSTVPWLAIYSTSNISKDSFLILKSFKR